MRWRRETSEADQPVERGHPAHQGRYSSDDKKFDGIPIAWKETAGYSTGVVPDFRAVDKFDAKLFEQP